jgi:sodium-dependent dicarboxylate transporter 2/3/5
LLLGLAFAASIGGLGTLIGTPTNALLVGFVFDTYGVEITFVQWMMIGIPFVLVSVPIAFLILTKVAFPIRLKELPGGRQLIEDGIKELGRITRPELTVAIVFGLTALLWIIRPLLVSIIPGISDTGIALFGAILLFIIPVDVRQGVFVLNWEWARKLPWGVLILFGGGLSLASAISRTGLASWIGSYLNALSHWPVVILIMIAVALIIFMTELASNSATAAAFLPILATVAVSVMGINPLMVLVPATLAASCAFMLPVGTPPNAIVYGSNRITIQQMARGGLYLNLAFILVITASVYVLIGPILGIDFNTLPEWATP